MNSIKILLISIMITGCYYTPYVHEDDCLDNLNKENNTSEYHGKEGKSEYGEYEPNE